METQITWFKLKLPEHHELEELLTKQFPDYEVSYLAFSDIWELRNRRLRHSIWDNTDKFSKIETRKRGEYRELVLYQFVLFAAFVGIHLLNNTFQWFESLDLFWPFLILVLAGPWLLHHLKPHYQAHLVEEHRKLVRSLSRFEITG